MEIININPKFCSMHKVKVDGTQPLDFSKLLGTKNVEKIEIDNNITLIIPKCYWSDSNGFALSSYKRKICFSRGIVTVNSNIDFVFHKLLMEVFWIKNDIKIKQKEESRIYDEQL